MSRGTMKNAVRGKSPVKYWLNWNGSEGVFSYWNGEENDTVNSLEMLVLDRRSAVTGWNDASTSRIYSNTVKSVKDELNVRTKTGTIAKGKWEDIKEEVNRAGGNFTINLYALAKLGDSDEFEPVCIQLDKSCLKNWTDFTKETNTWQIYKGLIKVERSEPQQKGRVKFFVAEFSLEEATPEMNEMAQRFDLERLQPYFNGEETVENEKAPF